MDGWGVGSPVLGHVTASHGTGQQKPQYYDVSGFLGWTRLSLSVCLFLFFFVDLIKAQSGWTHVFRDFLMWLFFPSSVGGTSCVRWFRMPTQEAPWNRSSVSVQWRWGMGGPQGFGRNNQQWWVPAHPWAVHHHHSWERRHNISLYLWRATPHCPGPAAPRQP